MNFDIARANLDGTGQEILVTGQILVASILLDLGAPGTAVFYAIAAPTNVPPGTPFDVTISALDPYGNTAVNYQGTVTFSTSDTDPGVVLPADYTFTPADHGTHTFVFLNRAYVEAFRAENAAFGTFFRGLAGERFAKTLFSAKPSQQKPWLVTAEDERAQVNYVVERLLAQREAGIALQRQAAIQSFRLAQPVIDIGTPNDSHALISQAALKAGKHVLCEKPLATSLEDARASYDLARKTKLVNGISHN